MLKFHKNETGEAQRKLCPWPGQCMSQDPCCQTQEQYRGQDTLASFNVPFFTHCTVFEDLQSQTKDTESRKRTTVLVGNFTKTVCVRWETATTMQTGLFCLGPSSVGGQSGLFTADGHIVFSDATQSQCYRIEIGLRSWNGGDVSCSINTIHCNSF